MDKGPAAASPRPVGGRSQPTRRSLRRPVADLQRAPRAPKVTPQGVALALLSLLALLYTLRFTRSLCLPVVLALLLDFLLSPLVGLLGRLRIPRWIGAALVLGALTAGAGAGVYALLQPAQRWLADAPRHLRQIERRLIKIRQPVEEMSRAAEQVGRLAEVDKPRATQPVEVRGPNFLDTVLSGGQSLLASTAITGVLLFFLLSSPRFIQRRAARLAPTFRQRRKAVVILRHIERDISTHLVTISIINSLLGVSVWAAMRLLDVPNPSLWGVAAAVLNFVPYVGAMVGVAVLAAVSLLTFDDLGRAILVPAVYLTLTSVEGSLVTPYVLGRRLSLSPVVVFLGVFFWGWIWGIPGALLAVPILVSIKICCDHVEPLSPLGRLLQR